MGDKEKKKKAFAGLFTGGGSNTPSPRKRMESRGIGALDSDESAEEETEQLILHAQAQQYKENKKAKAAQQQKSPRRRTSTTDHNYEALMDAAIRHHGKHGALALLSPSSTSTSSGGNKKMGSSLMGVSKKELLQVEVELMNLVSALNARLNQQQHQIMSLETKLAAQETLMNDLDARFRVDLQVRMREQQSQSVPKEGSCASCFSELFT